MFETLPTGALGLYTYYERLAQGLRQLMAGCRKFAPQYISRDDIAAITHEAAEISGIPYVMDLDKPQVEEILGGLLKPARAPKANNKVKRHRAARVGS